MQFQSFTLGSEHAGQRLDRVLSAHSGHSRSQVQKWIEQGRIQVNGRPAQKAGLKLAEKDTIKIQQTPNQNEHQAEDIPLDIIYESEDFLVINKAPGIVVHPDNTGHSSGTIVNALIGRYKELKEVGLDHRPGIVHRLDKDTSGTLIIAKNKRTHQKLSKAFQERKVGKYYLALVKGHFKTQKGRIEAAIQRDPKHRQRMAINPQGKMALTEFKVLESFKRCSLVQVQIKTGRTHQIRLHFASVGHPVIGDTLYGEEASNTYFKKTHQVMRQFLHAQTLEIDGHRFESPLSTDLEASLESIRSSQPSS